MHDSADWADPAEGAPNSLRRAFGAFATGVTVVATRGTDGELRAFTANSFSSVSLDPPLVMVCLGKSSASLSAFSAAENFSISILEAGQRTLSGAFAARDPAVKIAALARLRQDNSAPWVEGSLATFLCARHAVVDAGDHVILIGRVQRYRTAEGQPLGFFRGSYVNLGPDMAEIGGLRAALTVGGVLGHDGKVLLRRRSGSAVWEIPSAAPLRGQRPDAALHALFAGLGAEVTMAVPYSLFQEPDEEDATMIFSLETLGAPQCGRQADGGETAFFGSEDRPWDLVRGEMKQSLLRRYLREMAAGLFGVYFDTPEGGSVVALGGRPRAWTEWEEGGAQQDAAT